MILPGELPVVLGGDRLHLVHPPTEDDDRDVCSLYNDPAAMRYLRFLPITTSLAAIVERREKRNADPSFVDFIIRRNDPAPNQSSFLGICGFRSVDMTNKSGEAGIILSPRSHRTGMATIALLNLLSFGFAYEPYGLGLHRIIFQTGVDNVQMCGWLENVLGVQQEYVLREAWKDGDGWVDVAGYAILETHWYRDLKPQLEERVRRIVGG